MVGAARVAALALAVGMLLSTVALPAHAQGIAGRLRARAARALHRDTVRADSAVVTPAVTGAAADSGGSAVAKAANVALSAAKGSPLGMSAKLAKFYGNATVTGLKHTQRYGNTVLGFVDPKTAQAAERALTAAGYSLADVTLGHTDPSAMKVIAPYLRGGAAPSTPAVPASMSMPAADGAQPPDTAFTRIQGELQRLQQRATSGDTVAARQLVRFQQEMNAVALRLGADARAGASAPQGHALVAEMQRALACAKTGRDCRAAAR
jgi:hypothetical protein